MLTGPVVRVTIVHANSDIDPILVVLCTPSASNESSGVEPQLAIIGMDAIDIGNDQVRVMACDHPLRDCLGHGLEDRIDHRHRISHPHPHRGRVHGAHDSAFGHDHFKGPKVSVIDGQVLRQGQALEGHLGTGHSCA